jgi:hypothetical protein
MFFYYICIVNIKAVYQILTFYHSTFRWLVLLSLFYSIFRSYRGYIKKSTFTKDENRVLYWTLAVMHIQLIVGLIFYTQSHITSYFWNNYLKTLRNPDSYFFFSLIHSSLMLVAAAMITIGATIAKTRHTDHEKFKTILVWFTIAFVIIFIAIPWPFSPLVSRPYFR